MGLRTLKVCKSVEVLFTFIRSNGDELEVRMASKIVQEHEEALLTLNRVNAQRDWERYVEKSGETCLAGLTAICAEIQAREVE